MKKIILAALAIGLPLITFAKGNISGILIEKGTKNPIPYASVQLIDASTKQPLPIGTMTDENGSFTISNVADGKYILKATNVGSIAQERNVTVAGANVNVGDIALAEDSKLLKEVVVEGVRSQVKFELDRKVFSVDANIMAAGQSASEVLESIPSVEVDQDGEISLRGNTSVTVWINGKESGLNADNRAQILEQIPGETIDRIEVITNPSAKYSPEGTSGIINIILKKDRKGGYFGSAEIGANTRGGGNANFNFNYNNHKWETYASIGFRMRHNKGGSESRRTYDNGNFLNSDGVSKNHGNNVFLRAGATYHFDDKNEVYANAFGMFGHRWSNSETNYLSNLPNQWKSNYQLNRQSGDNRGAHAEVGYTHKWRDNHTLDIMAAYNHWGGPSWSSYYQENSFPGDPLFNLEDSTAYKYQEQNQSINTNSVEAKIDYVNQVLPWLKIETGFNGNYSHENTPVSTREGTSWADQTIMPDLYNRFIYNNNVSALYVTLGGKVKDFSFSVGLRGEAWQVRTKSLSYGETKEDVNWFKKNNFALFPSAYVSYSLPHDNEIQINYTRRIRRPWGGQLNSFVNISDPTNISTGNPYLEPQYSNAFELNYIKTWTFHMISVSAYYRTSNNVMNRISYLNGDVMYTTWANVSKNANSGVEIVSKNNLFKNVLDLTTTVNLYNNHISAWDYTLKDDYGNDVHLSGKKQNSFAWDVRMMAQVRLPWSLNFQATGRYASKQLSAQGSRQGGWSVDAGLRRAFGNWSVSLNCRDIFNSRKWRNTVNGTNYTQENKRWRGGRNLSISVKYSFGNMKAKNKKNQGGEPMDGSGYGDMMD